MKSGILESAMFNSPALTALVSSWPKTSVISTEAKGMGKETFTAGARAASYGSRPGARCQATYMGALSP